jgi:hypothetical protein
VMCLLNAAIVKMKTDMCEGFATQSVDLHLK